MIFDIFSDDIITSPEAFVKVVEERKEPYMNILLHTDDRIVQNKEKVMASDLETMAVTGKA